VTVRRTVSLTKDVEVPIVGFGTYLTENSDAPWALSDAINAGCRYIDPAEGYENEEGVGEATRMGLETARVTRLHP
jgi:diketogulonate reductase-like aldo/keto reductase